MTTTTDETIKITLSDRSPVNILKKDWPKIASDSDHDGQVRCQANTEWWIRVRRHADGRTIVYGALESGNGGQSIGWHDKYAGYLLPAGCSEDEVVRAIRRVGGVIDKADMADRVIADLPAEDLDDPSIPSTDDDVAKAFEVIASAAEFLRNGTPIQPGSDIAEEILRLAK